MKNTLIRIIGFIFILFLVICYTNRVLSLKSADGISQVEVFYKQPKDSIDVLILGSSHAFVNFNNGTLYKDYGIASYNLGASTQPIWNTYYYLREALKTQKPELIVLEGYMLANEEEYIDTGLAFKNLQGMKWSVDKYKAINASVSKDDIANYILEYPIYHTRYQSLEKGDFIKDFGNESKDYNWFDDNWKGQYLFGESAPQTNLGIDDVNYKKKLFPKTEKYYRKILELANDNNIPMMVVIVPYDDLELLEKNQAMYNTAKEIANEYGVDFLNLQSHVDEIGLDKNTDYRDAGHMTVWGTVKFSEYIGDYIKKNYDVSDRRNDAEYNSWKCNSDYIDRFTYNSMIKYKTDLGDVFKSIDTSYYWTVISVDGDCNISDDNTKKILEQLGVEGEKGQGIWLRQGDQITYALSDLDSSEYFGNEYHDFEIKHGDENVCVVDGKGYEHKVDNGINVIVYDPELNMFVDNFGVNKDDNYSLVR